MRPLDGSLHVTVRNSSVPPRMRNIFPLTLMAMWSHGWSSIAPGYLRANSDSTVSACRNDLGLATRLLLLLPGPAGDDGGPALAGVLHLGEGEFLAVQLPLICGLLLLPLAGERAVLVGELDLVLGHLVRPFDPQLTIEHGGELPLVVERDSPLGSVGGLEDELPLGELVGGRGRMGEEAETDEGEGGEEAHAETPGREWAVGLNRAAGRGARRIGGVRTGAKFPGLGRSRPARADVPEPADARHQPGDRGGPDDRMQNPGPNLVAKNSEPEPSEDVARPEEAILDDVIEPLWPAVKDVIDRPPDAEVMRDEDRRPDDESDEDALPRHPEMLAGPGPSCSRRLPRLTTSSIANPIRR